MKTTKIRTSNFIYVVRYNICLV